MTNDKRIDILELVTQNPVLSALPDEKRKFLVGQAIRRKLNKGEFLVLNGENWPYLFILAEGSLYAIKESSEGRSLLVSTFTPPNIFWGLAFFDGESLMPVSLIAGEKTIIYTWNRDFLVPILKKESEVAWRLSLLMVERMKQVSMIVEEMAFQPVDRRLARLLLDRFKDVENDSLERRMTLDDMATQIGTTREMVCRMLYRFSNNDLIQVTRTEFVLKNRDGLKVLAER